MDAVVYTDTTLQPGFVFRALFLLSPAGNVNTINENVLTDLVFTA